MDNTQIKEKFAEFYEKMANSKKIENMKLFGQAFISLFDKVADAHLELAQETIEFFNGINYSNFLTKKEAESILAKFENSDGTTGAKWNFEVLSNFLKSNDLATDEDGSFNFYALAVTMNMIYSDFYVQLMQMLGDKKDELPFWCYRFAIAKLHDKDKKCWIRDYFLG